MSSPLRSVTVVGSQGHSVNADHLIGVDESEGDHFVVVGVRCTRENDIDLVRALIENGLQPFRHKSDSIVRYGHLDKSDRIERVEDLLDDIEQLPITWAAVIGSDTLSREGRAAACAMAAKKSITDGLATGNIAHGCNDHVLLHDGKHDPHKDYFEALQEIVPGILDSSFQRIISPVHLAFLQDADRVYPQNTTADFIAGYLREKVEDLDEDLPGHVHRFDKSWIDRAPKPDPVYRLKDFQPVREEELRSRVIAWMTGKGFPQDPSPRNRDPYYELVAQIEDETVYEYLTDDI